MDVILQQKKQGQAQFRVQIDEFLASSIFIKQQDQLSTDVIQQLMKCSTKQGLYSGGNGKINTEKLVEAIVESGCQFNKKQLNKILGNKKQLRSSDIFQLLKSHQLHEFDLQTQIMNEFFENGKLSINKLDKTMNSLGMKQLNTKDKEIMKECFDMNKDGSVTAQDLQEMLDTVVSIRQERKELQKQKIEKKWEAEAENYNVNVNNEAAQRIHTADHAHLGYQNGQSGQFLSTSSKFQHQRHRSSRFQNIPGNTKTRLSKRQ